MPLKAPNHSGRVPRTVDLIWAGGLIWLRPIRRAGQVRRHCTSGITRSAASPRTTLVRCLIGKAVSLAGRAALNVQHINDPPSSTRKQSSFDNFACSDCTLVSRPVGFAWCAGDRGFGRGIDYSHLIPILVGHVMAFMALSLSCRASPALFSLHALHAHRCRSLMNLLS